MTTQTLPATPWRRDASVIGLVGLGHCASHFNQLLLAPLFPWLKDAFAVSYTELGFLLTIFFVVSCCVQAWSGFLVDRYGPRPLLFAGLGLLGIAAVGYASSSSYWMMAFFAVVAGFGNGVFHPVDYSLLNHKVAKARLGHAYSVHGITGSLGWALAPLLLVPVALATTWRVALLCAAALTFVVIAVLWLKRDVLTMPAAAKTAPDATRGSAAEGSFDFLKIPAVWMCFAFFFFYAGALSVVQGFAPQAARELHGVPVELAALCLSIYMFCAAAGMVFGGFLASNPDRCERIVGFAFSLAAIFALLIGYLDVAAWAVLVLFGAMGFAAGLAGPSRDLLVKQSTPANSTGRVYGVVYAGLDIGQAIVPLIIGSLMDRQAYRSVFLALAVLQAVLIINAMNVRKVRRTSLAPVAA